MKRLVLVLTIILFLSGCAAIPAPNTTIPVYPETQVPVPSEPGLSPLPPGCYDPDSQLENLTGGAVRVFPTEHQDIYGIMPMGEDILVFSGLYTTTLMRLRGENLYISNIAELNCSISPDSPCVRVSSTGITYYDNLMQQLVFLNDALEEEKRILLPEDITGYPVLSEDCRFFYYCTENAVRCLDLETGLNRLIREMFCCHQELTGIHLNGTVLECSISDDNLNWVTLYLSARTGALIRETKDQIILHTDSTQFFATRYDGKYREMLTGTAGGEISMLHYDDLQATAHPLMERSAVVLVSAKQNNTTLDYYDLQTGSRRYSLELPQNQYLWSFRCWTDTNTLWFLRYDSQYDCDSICRWDLNQSKIADDSAYLGVRRSGDAPDWDGILRCQKRAEELSERFGVNILLWTDATQFQPRDYSFQPEHRVPLLQQGLDTLESALSRYPEGFLKQAAAKEIRICLVRSITGNPDAGVLESAVGLQFWTDQSVPCIAITLGDESEQSLHHELFHIIETKVMGNNSNYDNWEDLNPEGFSYDYDYLLNLKRDDYELIDGSNRCFIDLYSMSYPREDRARIMEYAITEGHADYFSTSVMQTKLRRICLGIRTAFGLKKSTESYPWEQYLNESLAYQTK